MTKGIFAILYVLNKGLTLCYKTTVFTFIFAVFLLNFKDRPIQYRTKPVLALWNKRPPYWSNLLPF